MTRVRISSAADAVGSAIPWLTPVWPATAGGLTARPAEAQPTGILLTSPHPQQLELELHGPESPLVGSSLLALIGLPPLLHLLHVERPDSRKHSPWRGHIIPLSSKALGASIINCGKGSRSGPNKPPFCPPLGRLPSHQAPPGSFPLQGAAGI